MRPEFESLFIRVGSLFAFIFFAIWLPMSTYVHSQDELNWIKTEYRQHMMRNEDVIETINAQLQFYRADYKTKKFIETEITCLAQNIYFEAGSESTEGKIAVAEVVMNRKRDSDYPKTVCGVVHQKYKGTCQFTWVCEPNKEVEPSKAWKDSVKIASNILISKKKYGIIGNAKFYHATYVDPSWAQTKVFIKQIGNHLFYAES